MDDFSEDYSKLLLSKEWLVKIDNHASTPYLIKFFSSTVNISCCVIVTDTKFVWAEVMTSNQFARRWRSCNDVSSPISDTEEDAWRITMLELLSKAHTLGGIADLSFAVSESRYADHTFQFESNSFKWRWETCFLGHKRSAEIISKHLIFPLISVNHLAFSSTDVLAELPDADLEKAVDKMGRTARRSVDTHIRNALSKPRVATTLRRMTSMLNFTPDLPPVTSIAENPDLRIDVQAVREMTRFDTESEFRNSLPHHPLKDVSMDGKTQLEQRGGFAKSESHADSSTESEGEENFLPRPPAGPTTQLLAPTSGEPLNRGSAIHSRDPSPIQKPNLSTGISSDSESSPARPAKKPKKQVITTSDDDSEEERKKRVAQLKSGMGGGAEGVKRGTRQPIKRGGKRF